MKDPIHHVSEGYFEHEKFTSEGSDLFFAREKGTLQHTPSPVSLDLHDSVCGIFGVAPRRSAPQAGQRAKAIDAARRFSRVARGKRRNYSGARPLARLEARSGFKPDLVRPPIFPLGGDLPEDDACGVPHCRAPKTTTSSFRMFIVKEKKGAVKESLAPSTPSLSAAQNHSSLQSLSA